MALDDRIQTSLYAAFAAMTSRTARDGEDMRTARRMQRLVEVEAEQQPAEVSGSSDARMCWALADPGTTATRAMKRGAPGAQSASV